ncbi:MAG: hypothetical protein R2875_15260 [Desulfobacterales bacterium]
MANLPTPENLVELFENGVAAFKDKPAVWRKNKAGDDLDWMTCNEMGERVNNLRGGLGTTGVWPAYGGGFYRQQPAGMGHYRVCRLRGRCPVRAHV